MSKYFFLFKHNLQFALVTDAFFLFRLVLSTTSLLWAILIGISLVTTDSFQLISPTQEVLNNVLHPQFWMVLFAVQGTFGFTGVLLNAKNKLFVIFDSLLGALLWNVTTSIMIVSYLHDYRNLPPIWSAQIAISIFSIWALIRNKYEEQ